MFHIDLSALLQRNPKQYNGYEFYLLCWPFIILKDNMSPTFKPIYYTEDSIECLNGHGDFIVEHKELEIIGIRYDNQCHMIAPSYLKEAYDFVKQCEMYIG